MLDARPTRAPRSPANAPVQNWQAHLFLSPLQPLDSVLHYDSKRRRSKHLIKMGDSILTRKRDLVYLVFFFIHLPVMLGALLPVHHFCVSRAFDIPLVLRVSVG